MICLIFKKQVSWFSSNTCTCTYIHNSSVVIDVKILRLRKRQHLQAKEITFIRSSYSQEKAGSLQEWLWSNKCYYFSLQTLFYYIYANTYRAEVRVKRIIYMCVYIHRYICTYPCTYSHFSTLLAQWSRTFWAISDDLCTLLLQLKQKVIRALHKEQGWITSETGEKQSTGRV